MDLSTTYLGFELPHPLMAGASVMSEDLDTVKKLEDAGSSAIVLHSLFEEQIVGEELATVSAMHDPANQFAEALSYFPTPEEFRLGPAEYLEHVAKVKAAVAVPVIGSLNGTTAGGWLDHAALIERAGADAIELNIYDVVTDASHDSAAVEGRLIDIVKAVKQIVSIPVAVKLSPFYTSVANVGRELDQAGADALVLFNRFYQPDIDIENLEVSRSLKLSDSDELLLRLRWLAILSGNIKADLAVTGGVHLATDAIKAVMCGASAVQLVSALLLNGPEYLKTVKAQMAGWLEEYEYESLAQGMGSMSHAKCPNPHAFERANYMHILKGWRL